jgi:hypothetical protein
MTTWYLKVYHLAKWLIGHTTKLPTQTTLLAEHKKSTFDYVMQDTILYMTQWTTENGHLCGCSTTVFDATIAKDDMLWQEKRG